jgi:putative CocE/NonD family hydrolase
MGSHIAGGKLLSPVLWEVSFGIDALAAAGKSHVDLHLEWFDHWLGDGPATGDHESGVLTFVMGKNEWRAEPEWPLAREVSTPFYLGSESTLSVSPPDVDSAESVHSYDAANPVMTRDGDGFFSMEFPAGPFNQADLESCDDVLVFTTDPLPEDVEIAGRVRATLFAATDGPLPIGWYVRLCELDAGGVSRNIMGGIKRVDTKPGWIDEVEIDLWLTSILIRAGHHLRVQVTSGNFPRWDRNLNTADPVTEGTTMRTANQRILHGRQYPSRVVLPVIPA